MNALTPTPAAHAAAANRPKGWGGASRLAGAVLFLLPAAVWWGARGLPGWGVMWAVATAEFFALKMLTLSGLWRDAPPARVAAYLMLWPGMDAAAFLGIRAGKKRLVPTAPEWMFAVAKFGAGLVAAAWAVTHAVTAPVLLVGWVGMLGIIFSLHFGLFHLASLLWRSIGVNAAPLMRAPIAAQSLADFWSVRWNAAFADAARRFLGRPLARRWGAMRTGTLIFLVSGLVHESVISLPARGGWGGPTLYFALQAVGVWIEKSALGRRCGLGRGALGWVWVLAVTTAPVPLLFHPPFVTRVIAPFFQMLAELTP